MTGVEFRKRLRLAARLYDEYPQDGVVQASRTAVLIRRFAAETVVPSEEDVFAADVWGDILALPTTSPGDER